MPRERLGSRLGFILLSAGCAIGVGNVWKFPYIAGQGGGGAFVLFYLIFLVILGLPIMTMEFAVGRASRKSPVRAYQALEKPGEKWHIHGYFTLIGCYLLMMFYTTVAGWMLHYFYLTATGRFVGATTEQVGAVFGEMLSRPGVMAGCMIAVVVIGFLHDGVADSHAQGGAPWDSRCPREHTRHAHGGSQKPNKGLHIIILLFRATPPYQKEW